MDQNIAKKVWRLVRVLYFMLRKNISKSKLFLDLNRMMKRHKIVGKTSHNLSPPPGEYEFSCSNTPSTNNQPFSLFTFHKKHHYTTNQHTEDLDITAVNAAVLKAMEMIHSEMASPALPGFGRSPVVRQLRVTDSPFPLSSVQDEDCHVDEAAEQFISRFYNDLRRQNTNVTRRCM
ncbi:hypothetical protein L1987_67068 [Smallanthus sonchifolius]|uniref:Uncharacterized protein n=1 Tax=Smallanthus sonchifolius TaxID=185202 RepID=A0ACB9BZ25_9ASTR|nr:hypothetical protein L1987_67068 [Smallanthus sonchifolius]